MFDRLVLVKLLYILLFSDLWKFKVERIIPKVLKPKNDESFFIESFSEGTAHRVLVVVTDRGVSNS